MPPDQQTHDELRERLDRVRARIAAATTVGSRRVDEIKLVAVTKTHPPEVVRQAIAAGATDFGENRVQEAEGKIGDVGRQSATWHLIGHLQSNKARRAVQLFDVIHSLDSISLARKLDSACQDEGRDALPVLIQIDLGHEATKTGIDEAGLFPLIDAVHNCKSLKLTGLMTLPPYFEDPELARPFFAKLRKLRDQVRLQGAFGELPGELSMGMTNDFEVAIQEGATMVRVGTAIFGQR